MMQLKLGVLISFTYREKGRHCHVQFCSAIGAKIFCLESLSFISELMFDFHLERMTDSQVSLHCDADSEVHGACLGYQANLGQHRVKTRERTSQPTGKTIGVMKGNICS